jgi:hypothetical protein
MEKVKCADCGLLSLRPKNQEYIISGISLISPDIAYRDSGIVSQEFATSAGPGCGYQPICAAWQYNYSEEFRHINHDDKGKPLALSIITEERSCSQFIKLRHGFSPKEHLDMHISEQSITNQRNRQDRQARIQRKAETRYKKKLSDSETKHKYILACLGLAFALFQAFIIKRLIELPSPASVINVPAPIVINQK